MEEESRSREQSGGEERKRGREEKWRKGKMGGREEDFILGIIIMASSPIRYLKTLPPQFLAS